MTRRPTYLYNKNTKNQSNLFYIFSHDQKQQKVYLKKFLICPNSLTPCQVSVVEREVFTSNLIIEKKTRAES